MCFIGLLRFRSISIIGLLDRQTTFMKSKLIVVKPDSKGNFLDFSEIGRFKELFYVLSWRDIKVRYRQTILGIAWSVLQPLVQMVVFTVFFGNLAKIPSGNLPYSFF